MLATEVLQESGVLRFLFSELPIDGTRPAIFLDRDGVINQQITNGYVTRWSDFQFVPGMIALVAELSKRGLPIIVVSNQACVERGLIDSSELARITYGFADRLHKAGGRIDAVYYCPHKPDRGCGCRKPRPGLLRIAARDWRIDLTRSVLIGDSPADMEAARAVRCHSILFDPTLRWAIESMQSASVVQNTCEIAARVRECISSDGTEKYGAIPVDSKLKC